MFTVNNFETTDIAEMFFYYCLSCNAELEETAKLGLCLADALYFKAYWKTKRPHQAFSQLSYAHLCAS